MKQPWMRRGSGAGRRRIGASGWINAQTLAEVDTAWDEPVFVVDVRGAPVWWGAMHMFYPDPLKKRLLPSVRWEILREGCEDYESFWLLDRELGRLGTGTPERPEGRALLARVDRFVYCKAQRAGQESGNDEPANMQDNRIAWELRCGWPSCSRPVAGNALTVEEC
ncbi:MAG: DUF4091 domain-containing protein [Kiritimatiellaeota bacterium]|nr:DUF4091 domain-containing protein [Kiritimatiellota bacterium]